MSEKKRRRRWTATLFGALVLSAVLIADADAQRGGRGGGGTSSARAGVASTGSFSTSSTTAGTTTGAKPSQLPADGRPSQLPADGRGDWDAGNNNAPAFVAGAVVGANVAARRGYGVSGGYSETLTTLPCTPKEINAGSVKYYQCGNEFFMQTYDGGSVVYVQVDPPPQY